MPTPRATRIKKKSAKPKISKIPLYLYYRPDCDYSKEILSILLEVPILAENVLCVNVMVNNSCPSILQK
jgi:hypothetical protein